VDEVLLEDVGLGLLHRCQSILIATEAHEGRVTGIARSIVRPGLKRYLMRTGRIVAYETEMSSKTFMAKRDFFLMALVNLLWAGSYAASKIAMRHVTPTELVILRYLVALAVLAPLTLRQRFEDGFSLKDLGLLMLLGGVTFALSPWLQATGIFLSRVVDASLIIALEPVATAFLARIVLKEHLSRQQQLGFLGALAGFCILSGLNPARLASLASSGVIGNLLIALSLCGEVTYGVVSKVLLRRHSPLTVFTAGLAFGVTMLFALAGSRFHPGHLLTLDRASLAALLFLGLGCSAFCYTVYNIVLARAQVSEVTLTIYLQPVFGVVIGLVGLGEPLHLRTLAGGAIILLSVGLVLGNGKAIQKESGKRWPATEDA